MSDTDKSRSSKTTAAHTTLKDMLEKFKPEERYCMITNFEDAIIAGTVQGILLKESTFEIQFQNEQGKMITRKIPNEYLFDTPEMQEWFSTQANVSRKLIAESTGHFELSESEVQGDADLTQLFMDLRRKALVAKRKAEQQAAKESPNANAAAEAKPKKFRQAKTDKPKKSQPFSPQVTPDESANEANRTNGAPELAESGAALTTANSTATPESTEVPNS